jgi:V-type H+-transporting ATPase subunit a
MVATVPFLFAVMFGDIGHGIVLMVIAGYFIYSENKRCQPKKEDEV